MDNSTGEQTELMMFKKGLEILFLCIGLFCSNSGAQTPDRAKISEPGPRTISGGIINDKAISLAKPDYPEAAKSAGADGAINVKVLIDEGGSVIEAEGIAGNILLRQAAVDAAFASKFSPTLLQGQPVKVSGIIIYNFVFNRVNWLGFGKAIESIRVYNNLSHEPVAGYLTMEFAAEKATLLAIDSADGDRAKAVGNVIGGI